MSPGLRHVTLGAAVSLMLIASAAAQTDGTQTGAAISNAVAVSDEQYVSMAAAGDAFEIASSKLALDHSDSDAVRDFAQRMIDDHTAMSESLMAAAAQAGIEVPAVPTDDPRIATLTGAGADFDQQYLTMQVKAHEDALALHQGYAASGGNADLKKVAETAVPIVTEHLEHVRGMAPGTQQ